MREKVTVKCLMDFINDQIESGELQYDDPVHVYLEAFDIMGEYVVLDVDYNEDSYWMEEGDKRALLISN